MPSHMIWSAFLSRNTSGCSYWIHWISSTRALSITAPSLWHPFFPCLSKTSSCISPHISQHWLPETKAGRRLYLFLPPKNERGLIWKTSNCFHIFRHCSASVVCKPRLLMFVFTTFRRKKRVLLVPNRVNRNNDNKFFITILTFLNSSAIRISW